MYKYFFKRFFDILLGIITLPFVIITIIVFAPIIYFTDKGSVFYCGKRIGKDGKPFSMIKLRSMYMNAPDIRNSDGSTFNSSNDRRVTPIGRLLRKTSLDEIPQLLNVLIGDMTFIGPRPTVDFDLDLSTANEDVKKRYSVKPGVTGYAQAFYRNSISSEEKLKWNCYYVDNLSLSLDIKILLKTISSVIFQKNINKD